MTPAQMLESEIAFQEELKRSFLKSAPELLNGIRSMFQGFVKAEVEAKQQMLADLVTSLRSLTSNAAVSGCQRFAQMASAVEALVRELYEKPKNINQSTIRTIALALHTLQTLVPAEEEPPPPDAMAPVVLVVDDEVISRRTVAQALQKARLRAVTVDAPGDALKLVQENKFDLIFLDVDMPGMNGFDLCAKIRAVPTNKATPVVFVTNLNDFNHRTKSAQSGGNDLIGKPFMLIELAVKALTYLMQLPPAKPAAPKPA
jgi:CheY-like chemotaxis protein